MLIGTYKRSRMRILFITSSRLGDAIIASGILEYYRNLHPDARITVACGAVAAPLFDRLPGRSRTIVFEKEKFDIHWLKLWARTVGHVWDLVIDTRGSGLALALAAKKRVMIRGGRRPGRRYQQLGAAIGVTPAPLPVVWTAAADRERAAALLPAGPPLIAFGPTANWIGKIWPAERFIALFRALAAGPLAAARLAIFAGPGPAERALAQPLLDAFPHAIDLVGRLSIAEAAACLERADLYVGNDSGLMHLAAAAGIPCLGLFGRSMASEYAPAGPRAMAVVAPGPAGAAPMENLELDDVLHAARQLLGQPRLVSA